jgi:hypothetical protein
MCVIDRERQYYETIDLLNIDRKEDKKTVGMVQTHNGNMGRGIDSSPND